MKRIILAVLLTVASTQTTAFACDMDGKTGLLPANNMYISVFQRSGVNLIDEAQFNAVMDKIEATYGDIVKAKGGIFKVNRLWTNGTVNASAERRGNQWIINMYGGLARHVTISADGLMLAACHELGHHIGGAPLYMDDWAAVEGQSDYWGSMKCARRVWGNDDNITIMSTRQVDADAKALCDKTWRDDNERALCARIAMAGRSVADLFASFDGGVIDFATPDTKVVSATNPNHPKSQCRLDTYFQGSLCTRTLSDETSATDPARGVCTKADKFDVGIRPLCWYKPTAAEL